MTEQHRHDDAQGAVTLRGAWQGQVNDPQRTFHGTVTRSGLARVPVGASAQVAFQHAGGRVSPSDQHGTYLLLVAGQARPLMSFTCHSAVTTGPHGHDDTQEADWQALALPDRNSD